MCISYIDVRSWNRIYSKQTISNFPFLFIVRSIFKIRYSYRCDFLTAYGLCLKIFEPQFACLQRVMCMPWRSVCLFSAVGCLMPYRLREDPVGVTCHLATGLLLCVFSVLSFKVISVSSVVVSYLGNEKYLKVNLNISGDKCKSKCYTFRAILT